MKVTFNSLVVEDGNYHRGSIDILPRDAIDVAGVGRLAADDVEHPDNTGLGGLDGERSRPIANRKADAGGICAPGRLMPGELIRGVLHLRVRGVDHDTTLSGHW